jgi:hypothetical protein
MEEKSEIAESIDNDDNFKSKKRIVVVLSIIILSLVFTGAELKEVNTFIFNFEFKHQEGLGWLFLMATLVSLLRYNNYARPYKDQLYSLWTNRLLDREEVYKPNPVIEEVDGYEVDLFPADYDLYTRAEYSKFALSYKCKFPFRRYFVYKYGLHCLDNESVVSLWDSKKIYFNVLWLEYKERIKSITGHREFLDVYSPYFLASTACVLFILKSKIPLFIAFLGL